MNKYEEALKSAIKVRKLSIGQEVNTPDGRGLIVGLKMLHNATTISPLVTEVRVWYGMEQALENGCKWVHKTYQMSELTQISLNNDFTI